MNLAHRSALCYRGNGRETLALSVIGKTRRINLARLQKTQMYLVGTPRFTHPASYLVGRKASASASPCSAAGNADRCNVCTSITAKTLEDFIKEIKEAEATGVDILELRLDFLEEFNPAEDLQKLMSCCTKPYIVTYRPEWEGGNYKGSEPERLATLKWAALRGAPFVDVEYKAATMFFAGRGEVPTSTQVILSSHNFQLTPTEAELQSLAVNMREAGADIVKIATYANDICDCARVLALLQTRQGPTIALAMGEKGQITRLLAGKYGGFLTFAALSEARSSAPGQPTIDRLNQLYRVGEQRPSTKLFGIIGNPVHHSKSPLIHNTAFQDIGYDGVYVPLLVDDLVDFLHTFQHHDFMGFSVTIPHKEAALKLAEEVDNTSSHIGACNTLTRQSVSEGFKGTNTDWLAAITAIETRLAEVEGTATTSSQPLQGKVVVVIGAGGAGRALAFGAISRGAKVVIVNRNRDRAEALAADVSGEVEVADWLALAAGELEGDVLANTTSVGMTPNEEDSPVPASCLPQFKVVFDAVYTPRWTRLLRDAQEQGCAVVDGVQMFVGQALEQFKLFTGQEPPVELMTSVVEDSLAKKQ